MQLIADRWYVAVASSEVPDDRAHGATRFGFPMVFWRTPQGVVAALDRCPHRQARLSPGRLVDGCIECPFHGFRFDGSGACIAIPPHPDRPIPGSMVLRTLAAREAHGFVWVWSGAGPPPEGPIPFFDFDGYRFDGTAFHEDVANHVTRAIENQLDYTHLPFVHRNTIGRLANVENEVHTEVDGDCIRFWAGDDRQSLLELIAPCIWRNKTGPMYQFLAFVPIDAGRMRYYVRTYQRQVTVPVLAPLFGRMLAAGNRLVLRQDTPVVESQTVEETRVSMGEVLVPSDGPIIAYRRWRRDQAKRPLFPLD